MVKTNNKPAGDVKITHDFRKPASGDAKKNESGSSKKNSQPPKRGRPGDQKSVEKNEPQKPSNGRRNKSTKSSNSSGNSNSGGSNSNSSNRSRKTNNDSGDNRNKSGSNNSERSRKVNASNGLRIIPLGGLNEIGKNMTAFEYRDSILIVDCGMSFPDEEMFGVDVVIPDFDYIEKNKKKVKGLVITHGHEDHIGGVPYLLKRVHMPVFGTGLTLGLIGSKLDEHGIKGDLRRIGAGQRITIGPFKIETIHATHSIADALCLAITTPLGVIFHTGDFKIDYTPVDGEHFDLQKLAEVGSKGVLLLMSDSTNAVRKGYTASEQHLNDIMENIFSDTKSRILIATFASNIHRIQTIINTAAKFDRKVALSGRSMLKILDLSMDMGYVKIKKNQLVDIKEIKNIPDNKLVIITTGSQGEPMSALSRMATNDHREVSIKRGDKIVLSSSPIPGNEKSVSNIVNRLLEKEAEVIYSDIADIHVSGHACEEELKLMLSLIKPKYFMPVHGEVRHLRRHAEIAESLGWPSKNIFMLKNGDALDITGPDKLKIQRDQVEAEPVFVDGLGVGDISSLVLRDRKLLSESGLIIVMATIDSASGRILSGPDIVSRGFVYVKDNEDLMKDLQGVAYDKLFALEKSGVTDYNALKTAVKEELRRYIFRKTKRSPVILPILMEA